MRCTACVASETARPFVLLAGIVSLVMLSCAGTKPKVRAVEQCPEYRDVPCLTPRVCEYDPVRRCHVCRCAPPAYVPLERTSPTPGP